MPQFDQQYPDHLISPVSEAWEMHGFADMFPEINPISATGVRIEAIASTYACLSTLQSGMMADPSIPLADIVDALEVEEAQAEHEIMEFFMQGVCHHIRDNCLSQDTYATFRSAIRRASHETANGIEDGWFGEPILGQAETLVDLAQLLRDEEDLHIMYQAPQDTQLSRAARATVRSVVAP
jgi:hypothetical protein